MNEIIVGVDGSPTAADAAIQAATLAAKCGRALHIVMAVPVPTTTTVRGAGSDCWRIDSLSAADQTVRAVAGTVHPGTPVTHTVVLADPATALCEEALRLNAWMIVVGNKRVQGKGRLLRSIAGAVARQTPCDLLIVHTH